MNYIEINVINESGVKQNIELFNANNNMGDTQKKNLFSVAFPMIPLTSNEGITTPGTTGKTYWTKEGWQVSENLLGQRLIILSIKYNYRAIVESMKTKNFNFYKTRMFSIINAQYDEVLTINREYIDGNKADNTITPRNYFSPEQVANNIIEITEPILVTPDTGIIVPLLAGNLDTVFTFFY